MSEISDIDRARDALHAISPGLPREDWHRAGRAAIAAGLSADDLVEWSRTGDNFKSEQDVRAAFRTITSDGGTGPGTLFVMARDHGWIDPRTAERQAQHQTKQPAQHMDKPVAKRDGAEAIWSRCNPATHEHPYIAQKNAAGVSLDDLRVLPEGDPLRINGERMAGALVVPIRRLDGSISSLQFITTGDTAARLKAAGKPAKLNLPGHRIDGHHVVGELQPGCTAYLVEGIGHAWACWQATGHPAIVCFGSGRMRSVAAELRQRDASLRLVIVPDAGKEAEAEKIARELACEFICLPEGSPSNFDVCDLALRDGLDVVEALLAAPIRPELPPPLLRPVSVADVLTHPAPAPQYVWGEWIPRGVVTMLGAHGGVGKSFLALMLVASGVRRVPLFDAETQMQRALFVSLEDSPDVVRHRLGFICRAWAIDPRQLDGLTIVDGTASPELFTADGRDSGATTKTFDELRALVESQRPDLVVIDNSSDAFAGDEIQRRQVRAFMRELARLAQTGCAVLLLAHVDKLTARAVKSTNGENYSGSTAWHNAARSRLFVSRDESGLLTLEHQKSNLGKRQEPITLHWPEGGLPVLTEGTAHKMPDEQEQGRTDDANAMALLQLIAEAESRGQHCSPVPTARNNVHAMLRGEVAFDALGLKAHDTKRLTNNAHRAGWLSVVEYRTADRKSRERWTVTETGRRIAEIPAALSALSAPCTKEGAEGAEGAREVRFPSALSSGGYGGESAQSAESAKPKKRTHSTKRKARKVAV